jgi:hypothetical protein
LNLFSRIRDALSSLGAKPAVPATIASTLRIIEVADAAALAGDLFFRAFRQTIPDFPRHFVLVCEPPQQPPFTLGYVHQTAFHGGYLAGGLVVDAWKFRALGQAQQEEIRSRGGMGEWLMAESCRRLAPCDAVYACIGDARSLTVNTRVGFRPTGHRYLYVLPSPSAAPEALQALTERVAAHGLF